MNISIEQSNKIIEIPEDALTNNYILIYAEDDLRFNFIFDKSKLSDQAKEILLSYKTFYLNVKGTCREDSFKVKSNKCSDMEIFMIRRHISPYLLIYEDDKEITIIINSDH